MHKSSEVIKKFSKKDIIFRLRYKSYFIIYIKIIMLSLVKINTSTKKIELQIRFD